MLNFIIFRTTVLYRLIVVVYRLHTILTANTAGEHIILLSSHYQAWRGNAVYGTAVVLLEGCANAQCHSHLKLCTKLCKKSTRFYEPHDRRFLSVLIFYYHIVVHAQFVRRVNVSILSSQHKSREKSRVRREYQSGTLAAAAAAAAAVPLPVGTVLTSRRRRRFLTNWKRLQKTYNNIHTHTYII